MTATTIHACNMCGFVSQQYVRGLLFDSSDNLRVVACTETPMHICHRCAAAIARLIDSEDNPRSE